MAIPKCLIDEVNKEHDYVVANFGEFHSAHEGLAIIREEYRELEDEVFVNQKYRSMKEMRKEALQLATMALRFIVDVCEPKEDK